MKRFAQLIGLLLSIINPSLASAQDYELNVTMGDDGMPSEFFYADKRMSVRMTVDKLFMKRGSTTSWGDNTATVEVIVDEAFDPQILSSKSFKYYVLGVMIPLDRSQARAYGVKQVELKTPYHLIIRGLKLLGVTSQHWGRRTCDLKIAQMRRNSRPYFIEGRVTQAQPTPIWSIDPIADDMEIAKAFDLLLQGDWCVQALERAREKAQEKQATRDAIERQKETTAQEEDILVLTNQRLLQCAFDPACEKKLLAGVDRCKKTVEGNYVESCIRAIKISP